MSSAFKKVLKNKKQQEKAEHSMFDEDLSGDDSDSASSHDSDVEQSNGKLTKK